MLCKHSVFITETAPYGLCVVDENVRKIVWRKKARCKNFVRKEVSSNGKNK